MAIGTNPAMAGRILKILTNLKTPKVRNDKDSD